MNQVSSRIYENEKDFQIILNLSRRVRSRKHLYDYPGNVDIEENLHSAKVRAKTRLWFDAEQPIAWAYVDEFNNLWWDLDSEYEELLGTEIIQ